MSVPVVTISVRERFSQTKGVDQLLPSSRSTSQIVLPLSLSRQVSTERSSLSLTRYSLPPCSTGDAAVPQSLRILWGFQSRRQATLPSMSRAQVARYPKCAKIRSPSVTGVSEP